ncbi:ABC transporter substrate-binding protein [Atopobiaceae bacterium 24-176]
MNPTTNSSKRFSKGGLRAGLACVMTLCLVAVLALSGCGQSPSDLREAGSTGDKSDPVKVCFVEVVENDAFVTMMNGFKDEMAAQGYDNVTYDVQNAQGDTSTLNQIAAQLKSADYDVIVPIATPAAQACANAGITRPMIFISVTDPVAAGLMADLNKPDKNITGTSNVSDVKAIFEFADKLDPRALSGKVGILYCAGEKNAEVTAKAAEEYLKGRNIEVEVRTVTNSSEVQQTGAALASGVSAIYVPVDSVVQSSMTALTETATKAGVPVLGTDPVMVQSGALESVSCSNTTLGAKSADMAIKALAGTPVADMPVEVLASDDYAVNAATAKALGITISDSGDYRVID